MANAFAVKLDVKFASPARLMEVARGLEVRAGQAVKNKVNLATGETEFVFEEKHTDASGAPLKTPAAFHILIPIFQGGAPYSIPVRLRYRVNAGAIVWFYELHRADLFFDDAMNDAIERTRRPVEGSEALAKLPVGADGKPAAGGCGLPVMLGAPPPRQ